MRKAPRSGRWLFVCNPLSIIQRTSTIPSMAFTSVESLIDVIASGNQREMSKSLRVVPQCFTRWTDLFSIKTNMIAIGEQFLQHQASLVDTTCAGQILSEPETTCAKGSFLASQTIVRCHIWIIASH